MLRKDRRSMEANATQTNSDIVLLCWCKIKDFRLPVFWKRYRISISAVCSMDPRYLQLVIV